MSKKKKKQNRSRKNAKKIAKAKSVTMPEKAIGQKREREVASKAEIPREKDDEVKDVSEKVVVPEAIAEGMDAQAGTIENAAEQGVTDDGIDREIPEARDGKKRHHYRAIMWWAAGICSLLVLVVGGLAVAKLFRGNDEIREEGSGEMIVEEVPEVQPAPEEPAEEPEEEAPAEPVKEEKPEPAPQPEELPEVAPRPEPVKDYPEVTGGHKVVALTFDDGPSTATTPRLLDILKGKSVKATFFVLGTMAQKAPEILRREAAEGHEVASHTPYHNQQTSLSAAQIRAEALEMDRIFTDILGTVPPFTRPPYGAYNQTVQNAIGQPLIIWSVDPRDWQYRDASVVCTNVVSGTFDGAVILVHDIHASTVEAVPCIIDTLRAQGYEFLTVSELAAYRDVPLVNGGVYGKF